MRVLVSGHSGHVGGAIARHLVSLNHEIVGASRRAADDACATTETSVDLAAPDAVETIVRTIPPCEAIVHAAARISMQDSDPLIALTNCLGTQSLLAAAARWGSTRFIYLSSVPVIGVPLQLPITEEHPAVPLTAYHASKLFGEHLVRVATPRLWGVSLRLTSPVGPRMPENRIMSVFVRRAMENLPLSVAGSGTRGQNYVDVRDVAAAVEAALDRSESGVFNIAGDRSITNIDLAHLCVRVLHSSSRIDMTGAADPEEGRTWDVSIEKAGRLLGYRPQFSVDASIAAIAEECAGLRRR